MKDVSEVKVPLYVGSKGPYQSQLRTTRVVLIIIKRENEVFTGPNILCNMPVR